MFPCVRFQADFVVQTVSKHVNVKRIDPKVLHGLLKGAFQELQPINPSMLSEASSWAHFLYNTYSWSSCFYNMYVDPTMVKFAFSTLSSTVSWVLVLML